MPSSTTLGPERTCFYPTQAHYPRAWDEPIDDYFYHDLPGQANGSVNQVIFGNGRCIPLSVSAQAAARRRQKGSLQPPYLEAFRNFLRTLYLGLAGHTDETFVVPAEDSPLYSHYCDMEQWLTDFLNRVIHNNSVPSNQDSIVCAFNASYAHYQAQAVKHRSDYIWPGKEFFPDFIQVGYFEIYSWL